MLRIFRKHWPLITVFILSLAISWPIFMPGYFTHHDDLQVMRIFEMRRCFEDLQIPCRWVPDMGYGFGFPEFNYYGVLPYYIGGILSYLVGYIVAAKLLFLIPLLLGGFTFYFLAKEIFGEYAGFISTVVYLFAPYRALDSYVRGAVAESFAMAIAPLLFFLIYKLIKEKSNKYLLFFSAALGAFLTCHNIMTLFFVPVLILWTVFWLYNEKFKPLIQVIISFVLGLGLSAFFTIPAFLEKDLVQSDTLIKGDLNYLVHFVTAPQLFLDRSWGFGASLPGPLDTISFQIGWPLWWLVALLPLVLFLYIKKTNRTQIYLGAGLLLIFLTTLFMMHLKSNFIWESFPILKFAQFPWRLLSISIFVGSLAGGLLISILQGKLKIWLGALIVILAVVLNFSYFRPDKIYPLTDSEKLSGELWEVQQRASVLDYLPKTALQPREPAQKMPFILSGLADVKSFDNYSNRWQTSLVVKEKSEIIVPVFYFPNWKVYSKGSELGTEVDHIGRIKLWLDPGEYIIQGYFENTLVRSVSNFITLISMIVVLIMFFNRRRLRW